jgi:hypothetical protein
MHDLFPPPSGKVSRTMVKDSDPPRRPQPLIDVLKTVKALKRSPLWRQQQEAIAKLREHLALPPALAEALGEVKEEAARLDVEAAKEEAARLSPEATSANSPAPATEPAIEPAREPETETETTTDDTVTQLSSKRKSGPRPINFPHIREALEALGQRWPNINQVEARHIEFVIKHLRKQGDDDKAELQPRTIRRRIEAWLETRKGICHDDK